MASKKNRHFGKKKTAFAILGFLANAPKSGYEIKSAISKSTAYYWNESFGQIYPILHQLEAEGFIEKGSAESAGRRKNQKYNIMPAGMAALRNWLADPVETNLVRNELLLKIFFGRHVEPKLLLKHLYEYREMIEHKMQTYRNYKQTYEEAHPTDTNALNLHFLAPLDYGIYSGQASIKWCNETIEKLTRKLENSGNPPKNQRVDK